MTYQTLVQRHCGIAIYETILTTTVHRAGDALRRKVILNSCFTWHFIGARIVDSHLRLLCVCHMRRNIAVSRHATGTAIDITAIQLICTDMATCHINGTLTSHWSKLIPVWPAESKALGFISISCCTSASFIYRCCISSIQDITYRSHSTSAIDRAPDVTAGDVDHGTTTYHASSRVVMLLTVSTDIGVRTTTGTIDVTTVTLNLPLKRLVCERIPRIIRISNTDSSAIYIHIGILIVVTILTTTINRALDKRSCQDCP